MSMYITEDSLHRKVIDKALVKMLVINLQPGSIVEDRGFQEFIKVVDPKNIPPSRHTIMRDYLPGLYKNAAEELHSQLMRVEHCSIATDLWTSQATMGYLTVTCHFLTDDWKLESTVLDTVQIQDSHIAEKIGALLLNITVITDKICCAVTDNASNIVAAICHNKWNHLPCFAHTLNLIVTNSLQDVPEVEALLTDCDLFP